MKTLMTLLWILTLFIIFYQDYKERKVYALLFITCGLLGIYLFLINSFIGILIIQVLANFIILTIILSILYLYSYYKLKLPLLKTIAIGDLLFFGVLAISFPTITFLILFSASLIFSLVLFLFLKPKLQDKTVPLAGFQALFLAIVLLINKMFSFVDLYAL